MEVLGTQTSAFSFDNVKRNTFLETKGYKPPTTRKTGTTIAGIMFKDGIVLGADTRATGDTIVCDKNCEKIHYIAPNIYCCGAGTSADTESTTALISSQLKLHRYATGKESRISTAMTLMKRMLWRYQGHIGAALVLGGVDSVGAHLYSIYPHGSTDKLPYATMGSGSLAAMAVFEAGWKPELEKAEAMELVHQAILAGIFNDLGSGSNVDLTVITKAKVEIHRNYDVANPRLYKRAKPYEFPRGTAVVLSQTIVPRVSPFKYEEEQAAATSEAKDAMEE
jgi:20S proteasome subunit beta 2